MTPSAPRILPAAFAAFLLLAGLPADAAEAGVKDVTDVFACGAPVDSLKAVEVGGILVLRGSVADPSSAESVVRYAHSLGYKRIANLISVDGRSDDAALERRAEREFSRHRSLDGCRITLASRGGVVHIGGRVRYEMQKDVAVQLLRNLDGVKEVRSDLGRF